jgi:hypothetical protein
METRPHRYDYAMCITDPLEADLFFEFLICLCTTTGKTRQEAMDIERENLGYWAGYYDNETRERVERLFRCEHPVFGSIAKNGPPTPEQAFAAGVRMGERLRK